MDRPLPNPSPQPDKPKLKLVEVDVPSEVVMALQVVQDWVLKQGMHRWQMGVICSREWAIACTANIPKLRQLGKFDYRGAAAIKEHNEALERLRKLLLS